MVAISRADFLLLMVGLRDSDPGKDEQIAFLQFCMDNATWSHGQFLQDHWVAYETKMRNGGFFVYAINVASGVVPCDGIDFNTNTVFLE